MPLLFYGKRILIGVDEKKRVFLSLYMIMIKIY